MADWTDILDAALDPDAPVTSELAYAFRDNPIAIAEGAVGAPRVVPRALGAPGIASGAINGTTWVAFTGLGSIKQIRYDVSVIQSASAANFQVAFSSDGGTNWGATQTLAAIASNSGLFLFGTLDLQTGSYAQVGQSVYIATGGSATEVGDAGSLTVPANCNAIRFNASAAKTGRIFITPIGGRA